MMGRIRTVPRERYMNFIEKAAEYDRSMNDALERGDYSACVSNAVHCAICAVDAFTVLRLGKKSAAQNHGEAAGLLKEARSSDESEKSRAGDRLLELIDMKSAAEYDDRRMSKGDAERAVNLCGKIFSFIKYEIQRAEALPP